jgi:serine/threonine protein kinase
MALGKLGKYERVDVLGHGASGIVYLAWDTLLKKQIALKEIDVQAGDVSRFLEEARVMDRLSHPNIVRVNGVDKIDGHIVIDMEYVKGRNLQDTLRAEGRLPLNRALPIAIQTLDALDYAHRMRTVHRDIKPANILLSKGDEVKLVDFGLAEILATNSYAGGAGTYAYMAPEDFAEEHHSDHQSDIWAVGVTLYEMLTGARPFTVVKAKDPFAWRRVLMNEPPTPLSAHMENVQEGLQAILDRALAKDKSVRYQTAGEFRDALVALQPHDLPFYLPDATPIEVGTPQNGYAGSEHYANGYSNGNGSGDRTISGPQVWQPQFEQKPVPQSAFEPTVMTPPPLPAALPPRIAVSDQAQLPVEQSRGFMGLNFGRKIVTPVTATVEPHSVHFGQVRKGDERTARVQIRFEGGQGKVEGRVTAAPAWTTVFPAALNKRKQTLTITAYSDRVWQTGDYEDSVRLETTAGEIRIPLAIRVLKARPRFSEIALWFVPLFFAVLLPSLTVAWGAQFAAARYLVPAAALGSGLLAAMLLLVSVEADLGFAEKSASGILLAVMTMVLGVTIGVAGKTGHTEGFASLPATGVPIGALLVCQTFSRRHWKVWAGAIIILSALAATTFAMVMSGRG